MKELPIDSINALLTYEPDTGLLRWKNTTRHTKAGSVAGNQTKRGYWRVGIGGTHYPAPKVAQPLTDEQIYELAEPFGSFEHGDAQGHKRRTFARAIEAAHNIGGQQP